MPGRCYLQKHSDHRQSILPRGGFLVIFIFRGIPVNQMELKQGRQRMLIQRSAAETVVTPLLRGPPMGHTIVTQRAGGQSPWSTSNTGYKSFASWKTERGFIFSSSCHDTIP